MKREDYQLDLFGRYFGRGTPVAKKVKTNGQDSALGERECVCLSVSPGEVVVVVGGLFAAALWSSVVYTGPV